MKKFASLMVVAAVAAPMVASADMTPAERNAVHTTIMAQLQSDDLLRQMVARDIEFMETMEEMETMMEPEVMEEMPSVMSISQMRMMMDDEDTDDVAAPMYSRLHHDRSTKLEIGAKTRSTWQYGQQDEFVDEGRVTMSASDIARQRRLAAVQNALSNTRPTQESTKSPYQRRTVSYGFRHSATASSMTDDTYTPMY